MDKLLKDYVLRTCITYEQLGKILGVCTSTAHHWCRGKFKPRKKYHPKIERLLKKL